MYGPQNAKRSYQTQAVQTAGPGQLVLMCYDGLLTAITRAQQAETPEELGAELIRAQQIVTELEYALDHDKGGDIARDLAALYGYCFRELVAANLAKDTSNLASVQRVVVELREGFEVACQQIAPEAVAG